MRSRSSSRPPARRAIRWIAGAALLILATLAVPAVRRAIANPRGAAPIAATRVLVRGDAFQGHVYDPPVISVAAGATVTWTFADRGAGGAGRPAEHNVVGAGFVSPVIAAGSWSHTFATPGSYPYVCSLHPGMDGQVEVAP
ncbi:MAG TPA: plastocyanin/azurin family copper-binding protein [Herpetosiphonaceae bacterium]|nr:plastocyanin/azurin family copper-binding protein [Herpetosiphonaceae bacterium]